MSGLRGTFNKSGGFTNPGTQNRLHFVPLVDRFLQVGFKGRRKTKHTTLGWTLTNIHVGFLLDIGEARWDAPASR